jgi:hypothetical protein
LVRMNNSKNYWKNDQNGIFGNKFIQSTLSKNKYHNINRNIHIDINKAVLKLESISKMYWRPYWVLAIDDDAWKWTGRGGLKKKNDKKECKTGITSWKVVDEKGFVYCMSFEDGEEFKKFQKNKNEPFGISMLQYLDSKIPKGNYTFIIDAGALGGPQNAKYLSQEGRQYIISCSQSRVNDIFTKYFHQILQLHETDVLYGNDFACACFYSGITSDKQGGGIGEGSNKKMVKERNKRNFN